MRLLWRPEDSFVEDVLISLSMLCFLVLAREEDNFDVISMLPLVDHDEVNVYSVPLVCDTDKVDVVSVLLTSEGNGDAVSFSLAYDDVIDAALVGLV